MKNLFFLAKTSSTGSSYLHSWYPKERTEEKKTFFFKIKFSNHFRTLTEKHHGFMAKKKDRQCCQISFYVSRRKFWAFFFGKGTYNFLPFPNFEQRTFRLSAKVSSRLIKTEFNASSRMCWGFYWKNTFSSFFVHFEHEINQLFGGKVLVGLSNGYNYRETSWEKPLSGKLIIIYFDF